MDVRELKHAIKHCAESHCIGCMYRDDIQCVNHIMSAADSYIAELEERIAIMQESMEALEKRCNTFDALEQRCGRWVNRGKDLEAHSMEVFDAWSCSRCRYYIHGNGYPKWKYCPMCGCKMNEVSE